MYNKKLLVLFLQSDRKWIYSVTTRPSAYHMLDTMTILKKKIIATYVHRLQVARQRPFGTCR